MLFANDVEYLLLDNNTELTQAITVSIPPVMVKMEHSGRMLGMIPFSN